MSEAKWYVVHTYSGYENKVKANIDKTIETRHLEDQILEVRVPLEEVPEIRNGVEKVVQRKMFPGYVMIHMIMNDDTWYVVRNTRGVTGFVGPGSKPVPLDESEMENLGIKQDEVILDLEIGDVVTVLSGAWEGTVGAVQTINEQKKSLTINVELFGRETPVELELAQRLLEAVGTHDGGRVRLAVVGIGHACAHQGGKQQKIFSHGKTPAWRRR